MLTARSSDAERVLGLELGADDYLVKPFNVMELVARAKAIVRRMEALESSAGDSIVSYGALRIDPAARRVLLNGTPIALTAREFDLLLHFARHPGRVFTREQLLDTVWGGAHGLCAHGELAHQPIALEDRKQRCRPTLDSDRVGRGLPVRKRRRIEHMLERIRSQLHWRLSLVLMVLFMLFALLAGLILRQFSISHERKSRNASTAMWRCISRVSKL